MMETNEIDKSGKKGPVKRLKGIKYTRILEKLITMGL